ncbi:hypothetical protein [Streptomyces sp. NPDC015131]|uniref:hypothetical protein n=1 Tax=Streptomyces sp. NPDC015131 TaxID=3364941 RepID=UPI00370084F5
MTQRPGVRACEGFLRIVADFESWWPGAGQAELDAFRALGTLREAVAFAGYGRVPPGRKHSHMRRRSDTRTLGPCRDGLLERLDDIREARTFEELHALVGGIVAGVPDAGPLTVYDMARWIGAWRGLEPKVVHLHSGTAQGVAALGIVLPQGRRTVGKYELPSEFWGLSCGQLEDLLCHYQDDLGRALRNEEPRGGAARCGARRAAGRLGNWA